MSESIRVPEHQGLQEILNKSEQGFRSLVENAAVPIAIADLRGRFAYVNQAFADLMGYSVKEMLGRSFSNYLHPAERSRIVRLFLKIILLRRPPRNFEFRAVRKDGSVLYFMSKPTRFVVNGKTAGFQAVVVDITERKQAEQELRRERDRAQKYLDVAGAILVVLDKEGNATLINRKGCEILGYKAERILGKNWFDSFVPVRIRNEVKAVFQSLMKHETEIYYENPVLTRTGEERLIAWYHTVLKDDEGQVVGRLSSGNDITEERHAESLLKESEERYRGIMEASFDAILTIDPEGLITYVSPAAKKIIGYTPDEMLGKPFRNYLPESAVTKAFEFFSKALSGASVSEFALEVLRKDGSLATVEINASPLIVGGKLIGVQGSARDITERKAMEERIRESEEKFRGITERSFDAIITTDLEGCVSYASPSVVKLGGFSAEEVTGKPFQTFFKGLDMSGAVEVFSQVLQGESGVVQMEILKKDGSVAQIEVNASAITVNGELTGIQAIVRNITERKQMENRLKDSEERLRRLIELAPDAIYVNDLEGTFIEGNKQAESMTGYAKDELIGKNFFSVGLLDKRYISKAMELLQKNANGQKAGPEEFELTRKDGSRITIEILAIPVERGGKVEILGIARDITERKKIENALRDSEAKYRLLFDNVNDVVFSYDDEFRLLSISPSVKKTLGYEPEELVGKRVAEVGLMTPECMEAALANATQVLTGKDVGSTMYEFIKKDGSRAFGEVNSSPLIREGKVVGVIAVARDITERKEMEDALRESEEKIRNVLQSSPDAIAVMDLNGNIVEVNQASLGIFGFASREDATGKNTLTFVANRDKERVLKDMAQTVERGSLKNAEYTFLDTDGHEFPAEVSASLMRDASGNPKYFVTIVKNITERKQMLRKLEDYSQHLEELVDRRTRQLREAEEQLVKSERLAAIGQVAAMVGHDLRNPLTGISGATYYLKTKLGPSAEKKTLEMLELIEKDVQYSDKIITDLMDYSREIMLEFSETNPSAIVKEALSLVQVLQNLQLQDSTQNQPKVIVDINKTKRVFANLINNAIDAMPQGGKLSISSRKSGSDVEFVFADTGTGMTKEVMERIWTPFFTTKAKGMGLGLPICKRHVEAHGGKISVESIEGEGTTFTVTIPIEPKPRSEGGEKVWVNLPESLSSTTTKA